MILPKPPQKGLEEFNSDMLNTQSFVRSFMKISQVFDSDFVATKRFSFELEFWSKNYYICISNEKE